MAEDDGTKARELQSQIHYKLIEELSQSEKRFRYLVNGIHDLVFTLDSSGCIRFANRAWESVLGLDPVHVVGTVFIDYFRNEERSRIFEVDTTVQGDNRYLVRAVTIQDVPMVRKYGGIVWVDLTIEASVDGHFDGIAINISQRKMAQELVRKHAVELEEEVSRKTKKLQDTIKQLQATQAQMVQQARAATVGNLVSGLAHEIRNPLNLIVGGAEKLQELLDELEDNSDSSDEFVDEARAYANLIYKGSFRVDGIVRNLNQLASTGKVPSKHRCSVKDTVEATLEILHENIRQAAVLVEVSLPAELMVKANSSELSQVVLNLVLNAIQAMGKGGKLCVRAEQRGDFVAIEVEDNGPGVPADLKSQIFDAFFTTKEQGVGTGLGLAVSQQMISDSDGELTLVPSDEGALFRVMLPVEPATSR